MPDRVYDPLQAHPWGCEKCDARGEVQAPFNAAYDDLVLAAHYQHIEKSRDCANEWGARHIWFAQTSPYPD